MRGDYLTSPLFCTPNRLIAAFPALTLEADEAMLRICSTSPLIVVSSAVVGAELQVAQEFLVLRVPRDYAGTTPDADLQDAAIKGGVDRPRSEEHTSELQSPLNL